MWKIMELKLGKKKKKSLGKGEENISRWVSEKVVGSMDWSFSHIWRVVGFGVLQGVAGKTGGGECMDEIKIPRTNEDRIGIGNRNYRSVSYRNQPWMAKIWYRTAGKKTSKEPRGQGVGRVTCIYCNHSKRRVGLQRMKVSKGLKINKKWLGWIGVDKRNKSRWHSMRIWRWMEDGDRTESILTGIRSDLGYKGWPINNKITQTSLQLETTFLWCVYIITFLSASVIYELLVTFKVTSVHNKNYKTV